MANLSFSTELQWQGTGREGRGEVRLGDHRVAFSTPDSMNGMGIGSSPEELLIAAVGSCYSGTLFGLLRKKGLPVDRVYLRVEGTVTGYPLQAKFAELRVYPTIEGGDTTQKAAYQQTAMDARDKCFIGKTIAGNVQYDVGEISMDAERV